MDRLKDIENDVAGVTERVSPAYVSPLQRTKGQPPPIAANGGLSYMSFDRDGDAGTVAATEAALRLIAEGAGTGGYRHDRKRAPRPDQDEVGRWVS